MAHWQLTVVMKDSFELFGKCLLFLFGGEKEPMWKACSLDRQHSTRHER